MYGQGKRRILIYCEEQMGVLQPVSLELVGKGKELAETEKMTLCGVILGEKSKELALELSRYEVEEVYYMEHSSLGLFQVKNYADGLMDVVKKLQPEILLIGGTPTGKDLAATVAARCETGLTAECTELEIEQETGLLLQMRPAYGGNVEATIVCKGKYPQMATVRSGVFQAGKRGEERSEIVTEIKMPISLGDSLESIVGVKKREVDTLYLEQSEIIVAGGKGAKSPRAAQLIEELAQVLGGVVAASRGAVELGLWERSRQVGQTGSTVRPKLYIGCGISGKNQHMVGIREAECVIGINADANAEFLKEADYGICGEIEVVLPQIIERLKGKD